MKIPIGIFFGGATSSRDHSLRTAQRIYEQLQSGNFDPLPVFVDPFGQLILLDQGMPTNDSISEFYPSAKYFSAGERAQFTVYPEQLGSLGDPEKQAMARELGRPLSFEELPEHISMAFLALPDVEQLQSNLSAQRIPHTGEPADLLDLIHDRYGLHLQLQKNGFDMPAALRLSTKDWQDNSLQAIWGEDTVSVAYPLLLRPSHPHGAGRSSVVTSKDGPEGLRRAIDLAFGQKRLPAEDWLDMNPVDRENFVRQLAQWPSGIGFPLELNTGQETIVFQRPRSLMDYLKQTAADRPDTTYIFRSQQAADDILVSSLPEGTALSCLLIRQEDGSWDTASLRFLGPSRALVAGTEQFPAANGPVPRISDSLQEQLITHCEALAESLPATSGIRIFGILSSAGTLIPGEVQAFTGPINRENLSGEALKSFIIASLRARQAANPDPAYRSLLETLSSGATPALANSQAPPEPEGVPYIPPQSSDKPAVIANKAIYERELEKLNKEKEVMPESTSSIQESPSQERRRKKAAGWWPSVKAFFSSRVFLRNLGAAALFVVLLFLLLNMGLRVYTKHGDSMQLEDYQGLLLEDATRKAKAKGLKMEVISTSFQPGKRANEIFAQYPEPLSNVKEDRTVFVSVYQGKGKLVTLPAFTEVGDDIDNYRRELGKRKIRLLVKDQNFDPKLAEGTILYLIVDGERITNTQLRQGKVEVPEGEAVDAVISTRQSDNVELPDLLCKTFDAAQFEIRAKSLVLGKVYGGTDGNRSDYYVWKQEPATAPGKLIPKGAQINLYLTATRPDNCEN
ncbi:PASTA domain-containing protein [Flavilitoribacter nigricans]|uniref:PASTA domain-containing protein n=1 Tax=Flavilitoribacter nigricans (strain ATCC 23147 / DSM 23189 / NBRC 102662 / NCIMB 1420 / SS-2) TaxID=1122177 RepID=A0A2D0NGJ6_FLAN2|nr:PASTA domain-containing protein [Flavilitoribacter nigricans]PHN07597.1 hypothetical protein CRP01_05710 [Flavilitoribacter nigricans DSM 23189 = NBRC 102662]